MMRVFLLVLLVLTGLAGCSGTLVNMDHPLIQTDETVLAANVYFLRPKTERTMGVADNKLLIEFDGQHMLNLAKGEYTMVRLKPGPVDVTVKSMTIWGPFDEMKQMERTRPFIFSAGETYFISLDMVNGEFRGIYFRLDPVDLIAAKETAKYLHAIGSAKNAPIESLER